MGKIKVDSRVHLLNWTYFIIPLLYEVNFRSLPGRKCLFSSLNCILLWKELKVLCMKHRHFHDNPTKSMVVPCELTVYLSINWNLKVVLKFCSSSASKPSKRWLLTRCGFLFIHKFIKIQRAREFICKIGRRMIWRNCPIYMSICQ